MVLALSLPANPPGRLRVVGRLQPSASSLWGFVMIVGVWFATILGVLGGTSVSGVGVLSVFALLLLLCLFLPLVDFFGSKLSFKTLSLLMRDLSEVRSSLAREARNSVVRWRVLSWLGEAAAAAVGSLLKLEAAVATQCVLAARLTFLG